jgi:GNAT superfamily N-acetyltransferase
LAAFRGSDDRPDPAFLDDAVAFVALEGERVAGWAWGHETGRPDGGSTLLLQELELHEAHRRDGVGKLLVDAFVAHAHDLGLNAMWLFTHAGSDVERRIDERAGGAPGPRTGFWWVFE